MRVSSRNQAAVAVGLAVVAIIGACHPDTPVPIGPSGPPSENVIVDATVLANQDSVCNKNDAQLALDRGLDSNATNFARANGYYNWCIPDTTTISASRTAAVHTSMGRSRMYSRRPGSKVSVSRRPMCRSPSSKSTRIPITPPRALQPIATRRTIQLSISPVRRRPTGACFAEFRRAHSSSSGEPQVSNRAGRSAWAATHRLRRPTASRRLDRDSCDYTLRRRPRRREPTHPDRGEMWQPLVRRRTAGYGFTDAPECTRRCFAAAVERSGARERLVRRSGSRRSG